MAARHPGDGIPSMTERADAGALTAGKMLIGAVTAGLAAALLLHFLPDTDLAFERAFYLGSRRFVGNDSLLFDAARLFFKVLFFSICVLTAVGLFVSLRARRDWLTLSSRKWLYLALCLLAGPLFVANLGFKDHWGRARPHNVIEFGGEKEFSAPLLPSDQCRRNCSFVSGEASQIYLIFFAAAFLFRSSSGLLVLGGMVMGSLAGLVRMVQGAHFFSDVLFAGVLMAITAAVVRLLFEALPPRPEREPANRSGNPSGADPAQAGTPVVEVL